MTVELLSFWKEARRFAPRLCNFKLNFSSTIKVMLRSLWLGRNLLQSTDDTRLHHQLSPMNIFYEPGLSQVSISVIIKTRISFKLFPGYYRRLSIQGSHAQHDNICCSSEFHYKRKRWKNLCRRWLQRNGRYWWILRFGEDLCENSTSLELENIYC